MDASPDKAAAVVCDVTEEAQVERLVVQRPPMDTPWDILVAYAFSGFPGAIDASGPDALELCSSFECDRDGALHQARWLDDARSRRGLHHHDLLHIGHRGAAWAGGDVISFEGRGWTC